MKLSEFKHLLKDRESLSFQLPDGSLVPHHFHLTELGKISKHSIDCGGTVRTDEAVNLQLHSAQDLDHRLGPENLLKIIEKSENILGVQDLEIEVEYQGRTIEKFALAFEGTHFRLTSKHTDCPAKDTCGVPAQKPEAQACCPLGGACC